MCRHDVKRTRNFGRSPIKSVDKPMGGVLQSVCGGKRTVTLVSLTNTSVHK